MTRRLAALLALAAIALAPPRARAADGGPDAGTGRTAAPDAGSSDSDQEILDHLDEVENMELLENLELFDPKVDEKN